MADAIEFPTPGRLPDLIAHFVPERDGAPWMPIGAAWQHKDGEGFTIRLDLLPNVPGDILLRTR